MHASAYVCVQVCDAPGEEDVEWSQLFSPTDGRLLMTLTFGCMEVAYNMAFYVIVFSAGTVSDQLLLITLTLTLTITITITLTLTLTITITITITLTLTITITLT